MTSYTIYDYTFDVEYPTNLEITCTGKHNYSGNLTGNNPWQMYVVFDNAIQGGGVSGSGAVTDGPIVRAVVTGVGVGSHRVQIAWVSTSSYMSLQDTVFSMLTTTK